MVPGQAAFEEKKLKVKIIYKNGLETASTNQLVCNIWRKIMKMLISEAETVVYSHIYSTKKILVLSAIFETILLALLQRRRESDFTSMALPAFRD